MSRELSRKCFKCGCSPRDGDIKLFRFPKPGPTNTLKCEVWAKFCHPAGEWFSTTFQHKLYTEHRMLCEKHFKKTSFVNWDERKLDRQALPHADSDENPMPSVATYIPGPSCCSKAMEPLPGTSGISKMLRDITNIPQGKQQDPAPFVATYASIPGPSIHSNSMAVAPVPDTSQMLRDVTNIPKGKQKVLPLVSSCKIKPEKERKLYIKCRKYIKKICQLRNQIKKMKKKETLTTLNNDSTLKKLIKHLTPSFALLLQGQLRNLKRKFKGRRWSTEEKIIALRLFKRSPTCYRLLRRLWCLPAPSTLKSLLGCFKLEVGINEKALAVLKKSIDSQQPSDNEYVLMWDEMSIKKHLEYNKKKDVIEGYQDHGRHGRSQQEATHALVFMVAGIRKKVKQPIAYYLSSSFVTADRLSVLIKEVLNKCFEFGICISATVCDMDGVNRRALTTLGASKETPYFNLNNNQIVNIFDPPHLLKCFRNLFLKYNIKCASNISSDGLGGQGIAKWSHIQQFFEIDNNNPNFVFAPTLRKDHLNPNAKEKMKVNLAAQVLSHSVAAGMYAKISQGELTSEALVTAEVIGNIDKLFDCLNSDNPDLRRGKPYATNLSNASPHLKLFKMMKHLFTTLEFIGCRSPPSQQGWIWTLNAVEHLWKNLKNKHGIKSLATRRLQQDPIENLFGCIRSNCGSNCNPTTGQFIAGLKTAILANLAHIGKGNCEADNYENIMKNYKDVLNPSNVAVEQFPEAPITTAVMSAVDDSYDVTKDESSGEIQACAYVCGFLLKNIKSKCHNCEAIFYSDEDDDMVHIFTNFKEYNEIKRSLKYASKSFINCVEHCATIVNNYFKINGHTSNLRENVTVECEEEADFKFLNRCLPHSVQNIDYIIKSVFYICVKRYCILKNRAFSDAASAAKLKRKMDILKHT